MADPIFREHRIPSAGAKPYILAEGPGGTVWFCESGTGKIGCLRLASADVVEFALPDPACAPIGIVQGADGAMWFTQSAAGRIGRITVDGALSEFDLPMCGSRSTALGRWRGSALMARCGSSVASPPEGARLHRLRRKMPCGSAIPWPVASRGWICRAI